MGKIQVMSNTLASQVAAGEVIERPASVIKELVENSLDAGAKHITVEIQRGGVAGMRVSDDGSGMSREDALLCLERHATSKLKDSQDLAKISTMGFRGEAIPSIASVSRFRITSCETGSLEGSEIFVEGGTAPETKAAGTAVGTTVEVRDLFYNVPARRKFLRAESTESAHIEHQLRLQALAHPDVRMTFRKDGKTVFDLPASEPRMRIAGLNGGSLIKELIEVPSYNTRGITVHGFVLQAGHARKGRRHQFVFLNHRPIEDSAISTALSESFGSIVGPGLNPAAWLWIEMDASQVDVNVHPAKREVRFHKPHEIRTAILEAVSLALRPPAAESVVREDSVEILTEATETKSYQQNVRELNRKELATPPKPTSTSKIPLTPSAPPHQAELPTNLTEKTHESESKKPRQGHDFRVIGPLRDRYFVLESDEGLVLLDPSAAKERVIYEQLLAAGEGESIAAQGLLVPLVLEMDARDMDVVIKNHSHFTEAGIEIDEFGADTLQVRALPVFLKDMDARPLLLGLIDEIVEGGGRGRKEMAYERFSARLAWLACRNLTFKSSEAEILLDQLFTCDLPFCGADGRPTLIQLSLQELDRRFKRR